MSVQDGHEDLDDVEGKVFIGGLSWQTTEGGLRAHFEKFGELTDVALMIDKRTGQPRGFGFIKLKYPAAADIVVAQEHVIDGRKVDVKKAVPRDRAPAPTRTESKKVFVGGLSAEVTDKVFQDYFSKFGGVKDAIVMVDRSTNRSRGFGFVTFETEEAVDAVIKTENTILGKWVEVKRAEPRDMNRYDQMGGGMGMGGMRGAGPGNYRGGGRGMGGMGGMNDMRGMGGMGRGGYGMGGRNPLDEYQTNYGGMSAGPYGRGYSGGYPTGYAPTPSPYAMQPGFGAGAQYAGYPQGYANYGQQMQAQTQQAMQQGYTNPSAYATRAPDGNDLTSSQTSSASVAGNYGVTATGVTGQTSSSYPSTNIAGYGASYGLYGATAQATVPRTMTAQDGYEGAYGAYRQGNAAQNRLDRGYKPY